ncbi:MAG: hypothetical protein NT096_07345 [Proteobacteria bacterium]|nr:hypothetical protein [Pseudomonadota bacterium]
MARIYSKDKTGLIVVTFPYDLTLVTKIKTIPGHRWHPAEKFWSFSNTHGTLEKILEVFEGKEIHIDLALQGTVPDLRTERSGVVESGLSLSLHVSSKDFMRIRNPLDQIFNEKGGSSP